MRHRLVLFLLCGGALLHALPVVAQGFPDVDTARITPLIVPSWAGTVSILSTNVLIGASTGGIVQKLRGGSFRDGFTRGALGGLVHFAGKRVVVAHFAGAGLFGRQIASVGSSIVRNASEARPMFETVILPVGPLRFYVNTGRQRGVRAKVDVASLAWAAYAISERELIIDGDMSASAGAFVFKTRNKYLREKGTTEDLGGVAPANTILLSDVYALAQSNRQRAFAHERVHILQQDAILSTLTAPISTWVLQRTAVGATLERFVDFNVSTQVLRGLTEFFPDHADRPWEIEAEYLARK
jgi:hypothetical protein